MDAHQRERGDGYLPKQSVQISSDCSTEKKIMRCENVYQEITGLCQDSQDLFGKIELFYWVTWIRKSSLLKEACPRGWLKGSSCCNLFVVSMVSSSDLAWPRVNPPPLSSEIYITTERWWLLTWPCFKLLIGMTKILKSHCKEVFRETWRIAEHGRSQGKSFANFKNLELNFI